MASTATVVGAGIAGLAAATGLARLGWDVVVIERGPAIREDGAGLTLWPNALRALDAIGAGAAVRDIGAPVGSAVVRRADGKRLAEVPVAALTARYGPLIAVHRTELHRVLADGFSGDIRYGTAAAATDGQVLVGDEPPRTTLVIGADGIDSAVRTALLVAVHPRPTGQYAARGMARTRRRDADRHERVVGPRAALWPRAAARRAHLLVRSHLVPPGRREPTSHLRGLASSDRQRARRAAGGQHASPAARRPPATSQLA